MIKVVSFDIGGTLIQTGNYPSITELISAETGIEITEVKKIQIFFC